MKIACQIRCQLTRLGDCFQVIALKDELIFLGSRVDTSDTLHHLDFADELLTQKVTDFNNSVVLRGDTVDGKVSVDSAHLVLETLQKKVQVKHHCSWKRSAMFGQTLVTPLIMLVTWEQTVLTAAISFFFPNHLAT